MMYSEYLREAHEVMESMIGLHFDEVVAQVSSYAEGHGCVEVYRDEEMQYSEVSFSVSDYGFCADSFSFDFDTDGVCVSFEFEDYEGVMEEDL